MSAIDQKLDPGSLKPLGRYLDEKGNVDYIKIREDTWLQEQWARMADTDLSPLSRDDRFAFWMNAYNLFTIKGVLIELEKSAEWKGNISPINKLKFFSFRKFRIAGRKISLNSMEQKILRGEFQDPRVHFAINCGSGSCPILFDRLYRGDMINGYLDKVCKFNMNDPGQVNFDRGKNILYVSRIFKWFKGDFDSAGGVKEFIKKYWDGPGEAIDGAKLKYMEYDWSINAQ